MSLTEKWERFKAEQKEPERVPDLGLKVPDPGPVIQKSQTTQKMSDNFSPTIIQRIYELNQEVEKMAAKMLSDNIAYSVRHHLMQARLAEAKAILKLLEQDNEDGNS
jgi:hypothetical protein